MKWRSLTLLSIFSLSFIALACNLYRLQIEKGTLYAARASARAEASGVLEARRGSIYFSDRNGNQVPAALMKDYPIVFASPNQVENPSHTANILSSILNLPEATLRNRLQKLNDTYELLKVKINPEEEARIRDAGLPGIYTDHHAYRFYPFGTLAAHVLGFVGLSDDGSGERGRYGVESFFEHELGGTPGSAKGDQLQTPQDGSDILLTIDRDIEGEAEDLLEKLVTDTKATGGTVIVEEPTTGKILALANAPSFDPNAYAKSDVGTFLNSAVQTVYEPGSVFKVITMAAGIDAGKITPETTFVDTGSLTLNGKTISNYAKKAYGTITMREVIENSVNLGSAFAERTMGHDTFLQYVRAFGIGEKTGIELPGEVRGNLKSLTGVRRDINFATASFGQGIAMTPLRLIAAISAIANGGVLMEPYIRSDAVPEAGKPVVSAATAEAVTSMMLSAVEKAGVAKIAGFHVAGKTGTAQIPDFKNGGYTNTFIHTYVGFAPASHPRFTILFKLDRPDGPPLAGATVVPAFRELAQFILNYYHVPPDNLQPSQ